MEKRLILRGFGVGALGGLLAFLFARVMAEPMVQKAIDYESGRDAAQDALRKAAGLAVAPGESDIFSRGVQRNVGIGVGVILFGLAMGGLFAVAYILIQRGTQTSLRPRVLALLVAGGGFLGLFLVPFLKYPANPPAIGHDDTIGDRSLLYTDHGRRFRRVSHRGGRRGAQAVTAARGLERDAAGRRGVRGRDRRGHADPAAARTPGRQCGQVRAAVDRDAATAARLRTVRSSSRASRPTCCSSSVCTRSSTS